MDDKRIYDLALSGDGEAKRKLFKLLQRQGFGESLISERPPYGGGVVFRDHHGKFLAVCDPPNRPSGSQAEKFQKIEDEGGKILRARDTGKVFHLWYKFPGDRYCVLSYRSVLQVEHYWKHFLRNVRPSRCSANFKNFPDMLLSAEELLANPAHMKVQEFLAMDAEVFTEERLEAIGSEKKKYILSLRERLLSEKRVI